MNCQDLEQSLSLYLYQELAEHERAACEAHLQTCASCRDRLGELRRLHRLLEECPSPEVTPEMLVGCRQALDDAIDREQLGWRSLMRHWLAGSGLVPARRAVAVLTLVVFGFGLGWTLRPRAGRLQPPMTAGTPAAFGGADLSHVRINSISQVAPDPQTGAVRITLDAERRVTLEGSLDDPRIRQLLVDAVKSYDNPGIRRDTLDALRLHTSDPSVREALMFALLHDPNAGVRLEALNTIRTTDWGPDTHQGLLNVVKNDTNVGIRAAAIDTLVHRMADEGRDDEVVTAFEKMVVSERNPSVRWKLLSAMRRISANEF